MSRKFTQSTVSAANGVQRFLLLLLLLAGMVIASPVALMAQSDNSSITGTITDPSGAVVDRAEITVISELTGAEHKTISNRSGFYSIAGLAPGKYTVKVVAPKLPRPSPERITTSTRRSPLPSTSRSPSARPTSRYEVTADETTLQADSSTLGRVITSSQADNLPLNGRNPIYLALTKAGITSTTEQRIDLQFQHRTRCAQHQRRPRA